MLAVLLALPLTGCGDDGDDGDDRAEVPAGAVAEVSRLVGGHTTAALALAPADVDRLASQAGVRREQLADAASSLAGSTVWRQSMDGVEEIYDDVREDVGPALVDVACRAAAGRTVHTDYQLHYAIHPHVTGFTSEGVDRLTATTRPLFEVLYDAGGSDRGEDRAAAVLTCHVLAEMRD